MSNKVIRTGTIVFEMGTLTLDLSGDNAAEEFRKDPAASIRRALEEEGETVNGVRPLPAEFHSIAPAGGDGGSECRYWHIVFPEQSTWHYFCN